MSKQECQPKYSFKETSRRFKELIVDSNDGDKKPGETYKNLIKNLKEYCGQLILIETIEGHREKSALFPAQEKPENFIWKKKVQLGIISENPKIKNNFGRICLTDEGVSFETESLGSYPDEIKIIGEGPVSLHWQDFSKINKPLEEVNPMADGIIFPKIKIFIGNEEVNLRFQNYPFDLEKLSSFPQNLINHLHVQKT